MALRTYCPINLKRRGFLFGAAAALALPPARTFYLPPAKKLLTVKAIVEAEAKMALDSMVAVHFNCRCVIHYDGVKFRGELA